MLHFDSHPDMLIPQTLIAQDVFNKNKLFDELSIENWIIPSVYAGHFSTVVWLKPPWANQIKDSSSVFHVGHSKIDDKLRVTSTESYFLSELLYESKDQLENVQSLKFAVKTVGNLEATSSEKSMTVPALVGDSNSDAGTPPSDARKHPKDGGDPHHTHPSALSDIQQLEQDDEHCISDATKGKKRKSSSAGSDEAKSVKVDVTMTNDNMPLVLECFEEDQPFVLDIDLDFFSTQNPFKGVYTERQYELLQRLYNYTPPEDSSNQAIERCIDRRKKQLNELKHAFKVVQEGGTPTFEDKERCGLFHELVDDLESTQHKTPVDWDWLHETGCTCDDTELPHHLSSEQQIKQLMHDVSAFLSKLPKPTLITIARSSEDDYCPFTQVDMIEDSMISILHDLYGDLSIHRHCS